MDSVKYLERIDYTDCIDVKDEFLTKLHKRHVYQIPFFVESKGGLKIKTPIQGEDDMTVFLMDNFSIAIR